MSKDLQNIAIIEKEIGRKLNIDNGSLFHTEEIYMLDEHENVIGLDLRACDLKDISFLKLLPNLMQLYLRDNHITDISVLKFLSNLTLLDLHWNKITDISVLKFLPNLTHFDLSLNEISDISVLKYLPNLTHIHLYYNKIADISVLEYLKKIREVYLEGNNINEVPKGLLSLNLKITYNNFEHKFSDNEIALYDNPIQTPPLEILQKGNADIEAYFKSFEKHGKLTIGDSDSGKTAEVIERVDEIKDDAEAKYISDEELIKRIKKSDKVAKTTQVTTTVYVRNEYVSEFAKRKAKGICQLCENSAPFNDSKGKPYLESHHITWLSREGDDAVENVIALCPNCHTKMHILDVQSDVEKLKRKAMENSKYML